MGSSCCGNKESKCFLRPYFFALFGFLQKIGKSLMLPVSVLPVAGILLGVGTALLKSHDQGLIHFDSHLLILILSIMQNAGGPIFDNLPIIFAIGVALGLTENDGVAALAAIVGFVVMLGTMSVVAHTYGIPTSVTLHKSLSSTFGMDTIDTSVFGGIVIGVVAGFVFKRFYKIELPTYLGFFAGKRFVPIMTAVCAVIIGVILTFLWAPIQSGIDGLSRFVVHGESLFAFSLYGFVERLLLPFGLHHIWNVPFFFQIGDFVTSSGQVVHGELTRFFYGDPNAGHMGGGYLIKMFGLPGAAFAIWHTAKSEHRTRIGSIMVSAALTSFLTGITEPIEFSFLFVAPILYGIHAVLYGSAFFILNLFGAKLGYTFSQGAIDYVLFFAMDTKPWLVLVLGPIYGVVYYAIFRSVILALDLNTPGRDVADSSASDGVSGENSLAHKLVVAFGGPVNILSLDACITRLRIDVADTKKVQENTLKSLGAAGVLFVGNSVQAIFGTRSGNLLTDMREYMQHMDVTASESREKKKVAPAVAKGSTTHDIVDAVDAMLTALGGAENIRSVESCAQTRLRCVVRQANAVNEASLMDACPQGFSRVSSDTLHLIVGLRVEEYLKLFKKKI